MNLFHSNLEDNKSKNSISTFFLICILMSFFWGIYFEVRFINQNSSKVIFSLTACTILLWVIGKIKNFTKPLLHLNIALLIATVAYTSLEFGGGANVATSFLIAVPMTSLLLLNIKELFIWNAITLIMSSILTYADFHRFQRMWIDSQYFEIYSFVVISLFIIFFIVMYSNYNHRLYSILEIEKQKINATRNTNLAAIGRIARGLAQEIKSPITIINGNISNIKKKLYSEEIDYPNKIKSLETILKTTDRILKITNSLEELSIGNHDLELSVMRVDSAMKSIENEVKTFASEKIEITLINHDTEDSSFYLNETSFIQVISNLLMNASDAISGFEKSWIKIESVAQNDCIIFKITDSGKGIDSINVEKIFSPFYTTKELGKGTGLGLSLSMSLAKKMKGQLIYNPKEAHTQFQFILRRA